VGVRARDVEGFAETSPVSCADDDYLPSSIRGWLPEIVPDEATDISELHNVDNNRTWACFGIPKGPATVRALLEKAGAHRIARPRRTRPPGILGPPKWWPASMAQPRIEAYELKETRGSMLHIGIDAAAARVCFERMAS
jgi:hypothetical protein